MVQTSDCDRLPSEMEMEQGRTHSASVAVEGREASSIAAAADQHALIWMKAELLEERVGFPQCPKLAAESCCLSLLDVTKALQPGVQSHRAEEGASGREAVHLLERGASRRPRRASRHQRPRWRAGPSFSSGG